MSVSVTFLENKAKFRVYGNSDGYDETIDVIQNLNDLAKIIKSNEYLSKTIDLDFDGLIENIKNGVEKCLEDVFELIAMYFSHEFAEVFIEGRSIDIAEDGMDCYYDISECQLLLK